MTRDEILDLWLASHGSSFEDELVAFHKAVWNAAIERAADKCHGVEEGVYFKIRIEELKCRD